MARKKVKLRKDGKPDKRYVGTSQTAVSKRTKKKPDPRLKRRRKHNVAEGYYPNPIVGHVLVVVPTMAGLEKGAKPKSAYWTGSGWDDNKKRAVIFPTSEAAINAGKIIPSSMKGGRFYSVIPMRY